MGALGRCKEEDKCQVKFVPSWGFRKSSNVPGGTSMRETRVRVYTVLPPNQHQNKRRRAQRQKAGEVAACCCISF